jgi:hypothetical protein
MVKTKSSAYPSKGFVRNFEGNSQTVPRIQRGLDDMDLLMTIGVVLLILWLLGLVTSYTLGGFIHILLVLAIIVILVRIIQGRRPVP